jgi:hypothetical protein
LAGSGILRGGGEIPASRGVEGGAGEGFVTNFSAADFGWRRTKKPGFARDLTTRRASLARFGHGKMNVAAFSWFWSLTPQKDAPITRLVAADGLGAAAVTLPERAGIEPVYRVLFVLRNSAV